MENQYAPTKLEELGTKLGTWLEEEGDFMRGWNLSNDADFKAAIAEDNETKRLRLKAAMLARRKA